MNSATRALPSLSAAITPGVARIVLLAVLGRIFGLEGAGPVSSDLSIMYFIGFVTTTGWATTLIAKSSRCGEGTERTLALHLLGSLATTLACIPFIAMIDTSLINTPMWLLLLSGYATYQCVRSVQIARSRPESAALVDVLVHAMPLVVIWTQAKIAVENPKTFLWSFSLAMLVLPWLVANPGRGINARLLKSFVARDNAGELLAITREAVSLGLAMLVSTGILYSFVPVVLRLGSSSDATVTAILVNVLAAATVLPRAVTLHYLPIIGASLRNENQESVDAPMSEFRLLSRGCTLLIAAASAVLIGFASLHLSTDALFLASCLTAGTVIPMFVTAEIHLMIARGYSSKVLVVNVLSTIPYLIVLAMLALSGTSVPQDLVIWLGSAFVAGSIARAAALWRLALRA